MANKVFHCKLFFKYIRYQVEIPVNLASGYLSSFPSRTQGLEERL